MNVRHPRWVLGLVVALLALACNGDDGTGPDTPKSIRTGTWSATAGFGSFTFVVASGGSMIEKVTFSFSSWRCGSASSTTSGSVSQERTPGWAVTNRAFTVEADFDPFGDSQTITVSGTFGNDGSSATGSWSADWNGGTCSGSWQGSV